MEAKTGNEEVDRQNEDLKPVVKFTEEQVAKAAAAKTPEEMIALAKEEGVPLTDDQLEAISGGVSWAEQLWNMNLAVVMPDGASKPTTSTRLYSPTNQNRRSPRLPTSRRASS